MKTKTARLGYLTLTILFICLLNAVVAQDIIITKDNQQIKAKIMEIGTTEVKFKYFDAEDGPTIVLKKDEIKSITVKGKNGQQNTMNVNDDPMSASNNKILDKTSSLKFHFFSPMNKHVAFSYEWMMKPGFNLEGGLGIIGPGISAFSDDGPYSGKTNTRAGGAFVKAGAKFLLGNSSDFAVEGIKYAHPLKGRYVKVELAITAFNRSYDLDTANSFYYYPAPNPKYMRVTNSYQCMALNLIYGRQYILGNSITAGWYAGIGYGFESRTTNYKNTNLFGGDDGSSGNRYSHSYGGPSFPFTFTSGFNIGIIMKAPKKLMRSSDEQNKYFIEKKGPRQNPKRF